MAKRPGNHLGQGRTLFLRGFYCNAAPRQTAQVPELESGEHRSLESSPMCPTSAPETSKIKKLSFESTNGDIKTKIITYCTATAPSRGLQCSEGLKLLNRSLSSECSIAQLIFRFETSAKSVSFVGLTQCSRTTASTSFACGTLVILERFQIFPFATQYLSLSAHDKKLPSILRHPINLSQGKVTSEQDMVAFIHVMGVL